MMPPTPQLGYLASKKESPVSVFKDQMTGGQNNPKISALLSTLQAQSFQSEAIGQKRKNSDWISNQIMPKDDT
jgi:hypothetical protein